MSLHIGAGSIVFSGADRPHEGFATDSTRLLLGESGESPNRNMRVGASRPYELRVDMCNART